MKTTPPPGCQGVPDTLADKRVLVRYRDMSRVDPCPYGQACRIVTGGEGGVANVHVITVSQGGLHFHRQYDEVYYVLAGTGTMMIAGFEYPLRPGAVVVIPAGVPHELCAAAAGPLEFVIFGTPPMAIDDPRARPERPEHGLVPDAPGFAGGNAGARGNRGIARGAGGVSPTGGRRSQCREITDL